MVLHNKHCIMHYIFPVSLRVISWVCIRAPEPIRLTRVMVYPVGEDSLCRRLPVCLRGWHASKTIYTNGGGDAGHRGGADAWRSTATCGNTGQTGKDREKQSAVGFFPPQDIMEKFCFDWPPSISWKCQRGRSSGPVKTLNVRADFLSQCGPNCDTTAIRSESEDILYKNTENRVGSVLWVAIIYLSQMIACDATMLNVHFHHFKASRNSDSIDFV